MLYTVIVDDFIKTNGLGSHFARIITYLYMLRGTNHNLYLEYNENSNNIWNTIFKQDVIHDNKIKFNHKSFRILYPDMITRLKLQDFPLCLKNKPNNNNCIEDGYIWCNASIYNSSDFQSIRNEYNYSFKQMKFQPNLLNEFNMFKSTLPNLENSIAVFVRYQGHYRNTNCNFETFLNSLINEVNQIANKYEYILLISQVEEVKNKMMITFGNKVIIPPYQRFYPNKNDWNQTINLNTSLENEWKYCLFDILLASNTKFIIGGSSNMFMLTLIIDPNKPFKLFDCLKNSNGL